MAPGVPRPFVHPVRTPAGHGSSASMRPLDHPWQHALWFTIKFVNGENFWEEYDEFGTLRQAAAPTTVTLDDDRVDGREHHRVDPPRRRDGRRQRAADARPTGRSLDLAAIALDWDVRFTPVVDVELDRTPVHDLGWLRRTHPAGPARLARHPAPARPTATSSDQILGDRADWCALDGPLTDPDGEHDVGVVMLDHPDNPGHPVPWYASTRQPAYALDGWTNFVNAAFLWDGPIDVAAGEELRLRYRFVAHDGRWDRDASSSTGAWLAWLDDRDNERQAPQR